MTSKSNGANYGAKRVVKATSFSPLRYGKPPKKKPMGYEDDEDENKRNKPSGY